MVVAAEVTVRPGTQAYLLFVDSSFVAFAYPREVFRVPSQISSSL